MNKRRVFDIEFPQDEPAVPAGTDERAEARRGPMAAAIGENADALRERQAAETAIREENDRLAHEHVRLKELGLITDLVPVDAVDTLKLTRDRSAARDPELEELKESILAVGLSNPIRVEQVGDRYELVQGFRRLSAYRELYKETGNDHFARIPAALMARGETLHKLYRRMVDENLVRRDISFAEMAELVRSFVKDSNTEVDTPRAAIDILYASAGRQKKTYILHFVTLLDAIGSELKFPEEISRALGLQLEKCISEDEDAAARIRSALKAASVKNAEGELSVLREYLSRESQEAMQPQGKPAESKPRTSAAKTTFRRTVPAGTVRCVASAGRVELRMERDFSSIDRHKLEAAVAAFFDHLDG